MTVDGILSQDIALLNTSIIEADKFSNAGDTYTEFIVSTNNEIITNPIWLKNHLNDEYDFVFQDSLYIRESLQLLQMYMHLFYVQDLT